MASAWVIIPTDPLPQRPSEMLDTLGESHLELYVCGPHNCEIRQDMDKKRAEFYKKKLLAKQEELSRLVTKSEQDGREADEEATQDIADKAANSYTKEFLFHQSDENRRLLLLVNEALDRVKNGSYGLCVACGEEVQVKRLEAVPWARHCIECQEKQDQGAL